MNSGFGLDVAAMAHRRAVRPLTRRPGRGGWLRARDPSVGGAGRMIRTLKAGTVAVLVALLLASSTSAQEPSPQAVEFLSAGE